MATVFRDEHRAALDWLNGAAEGNARFFGVEIGAVRIADSPIAPLFKLRAQPNEETARVAVAGRATVQSEGRWALYREFWAKFRERVHLEHPGWTNSRTASRANGLAMPCPIKGCPCYAFSFVSGGRIRSELYIDYPADPETVSRLYSFLSVRKEMIEAAYGRPLNWEELPSRRASRICDYAPGDITQSDEYDAYIDWFFDAGSRLRRAMAAPVEAWNEQTE